MKAHELIANPENWTTDENARDSEGRPVNSNDPNAVSFCLLGALGKCYPGINDYRIAKAKVLVAAGLPEGDPVKDTFALIDFNDNGTHTKVVEALRKADV